MDRLIYAVEERSSGNLWKKLSQIDGVGAFYEYEKGAQAACASTEKKEPQRDIPVLQRI